MNADINKGVPETMDAPNVDDPGPYFDDAELTVHTVVQRVLTWIYTARLRLRLMPASAKKLATLGKFGTLGNV